MSKRRQLIPSAKALYVFEEALGGEGIAMGWRHVTERQVCDWLPGQV